MQNDLISGFPGPPKWDKKKYSQTRYPKEAKPDPKGDKVTQLMPRFALQGFQEGTMSPNWSPNWSHKAPQGSQQATQDTQEAPDGCHLAPKGTPERPQKTPKMTPNLKSGTSWKKLRDIALFSRGNRVFQPKNIKNTSFLHTRTSNTIKNTSFLHTRTSKTFKKLSFLHRQASIPR